MMSCNPCNIGASEHETAQIWVNWNVKGPILEALKKIHLNLVDE